MYPFLLFVVQTANILGIFSDPFEFDGDYGKEVNPIRQKVFERLVSQESIAQHLTDHEIHLTLGNEATPKEIEKFRQIRLAEAIELDKRYGPTLSEVVTGELLELIKVKQQTLELEGFSNENLSQLFDFVSHNGSCKIFHFMRHNPPELLGLDKTLRDRAAREGRDFEFPMISSGQSLSESGIHFLKAELLDRIFTPDVMRLTKKQNFNATDYDIFKEPGGQLFYFWLYHALNLQLVADELRIAEINKVKEIFLSTLGNSQVRAECFLEKLQKVEASVVFTQECDANTVQVLTVQGPFLSVEGQNPADGTFVFLNRDHWEPDYEVIPMENYPGYHAGKLSLILATRKNTGEKFLLAAAHGHSTRAEDAREQIRLVVKKYHQLKPAIQDLQLLIGIDANTKSEKDVIHFRRLLDELGLIATNVGPTTIKRRMVTAQHSKSAYFAIDEEDYLITLKPENGSNYTLTQETVGFQSQSTGLELLPNIYNYSDHYPVGANLQPL